MGKYTKVKEKRKPGPAKRLPEENGKRKTYYFKGAYLKFLEQHTKPSEVLCRGLDGLEEFQDFQRDNNN